MWRSVSHFHGRYNSACLHLLRGNHTGKSLNTLPIIPRRFGPKKPRNRHHTTPISTSPISPPCWTHDPCQNSPPWERYVMREKGRCGERKEMRNREERRGERESDMWIKKYYFVLELCYSAILKVELHCSTIVKKFAIFGISISWCRAFWGLKCQIPLIFGINIP